MTYSGNPSLDPDVKTRVLETFRHSLDKAEQGALEEARLGCEFVSRLDPEFTLARHLSQRLHEAEGPIDVDDLRSRLEEPGAEAPTTEPTEEVPTGSEPLELPDESELSFDFGDDDLDDLGGLDVEDLPDLDSDLAEEPVESDPSGASPESTDPAVLREEFTRLLEERRHDELLERARAHEETVASDPELRQLRATAIERQEAEPYVTDFVAKAREARERGEEEEVQRLLDKAEALDPTHPQIEAVRRGEGEIEDEDIAGLGFAIAGEDEIATEDDVEMEELDLRDEDLELGDEDLELGASPAPSTPVEPPVPSGAVSAVSEGEEDDRIAALLEEGQEAFERGEYQAAIDAWSRIFLIDIDHQQAAELIDEARTRKAEKEREVEELYHEALAHAEAGETEEARRGFERVLERQPGHLAAEEYLERIEQGEELAAPADTDATDTALEDTLLPSVDTEEDEEELKEEILVPPEPGEAPPPPPAEPTPPPPRTSGATKRKTRPSFWIVAAAALVVVVGIGWFLLDRWDTLFPNTDEPEITAESQADGESPIDRALAAFQAGDRESAIARLERVPPIHPRYEEAQALLGEWTAPEEETAEEEAESETETMRRAEHRAELIMRARAAIDADRSLAAMRYYEQAAEISPLGPEDAAGLAAAREDLGHLEDELQLVRNGEFDRVMRDLWLLQEENPGDPDIRELLATAYFNLGVRNLQQSNFADAKENLTESKNLGLDDRRTDRLIAMAETYGERSEDLLYRIFVKYLEPRAI